MAGEEQQQISVRAHFERFPATIKGAFVVRCVDGDPHQVVIRGGTVTEVASSKVRPIGLAPATLQAAPRSDLFVPFEFPVTELGPGWYELVCEVDIDGRSHDLPMDRMFAVAWPRASVRRGAVPVGRKLSADGGPEVNIDHVDCSGDSIKVHFASEEPAALKLAADGAPLATLASEFDEESGVGTTTAYPLMKTHSMLTIELKASPNSLDVPLP